MISYDTDPSLHPGQPEPPQLDDGFSPPVPQPAPAETHAPVAELTEKSEF
jgi:hypothetical protein